MSNNSVVVKDLKFKIDSLDVRNNSIIIYGKCSNLFKCNDFYFIDNLDNKYDVLYLDSISSDINIFMVEVAMDNVKSLSPKQRVPVKFTAKKVRTKNQQNKGNTLRAKYT